MTQQTKNDGNTVKKRRKRTPREIKVTYENKCQPGTLEKIWIAYYVKKFKNGEEIL